MTAALTPAQLAVLQYWIFVGLAGAIVGSFLNVCIYRLPLGRSVVSPPSSCPACGARIRPWHNVPILGWLWLRGKCANCRAAIPVRYPAVEAANAALWLLAWYRFGPGPQALLLMPFLSALLALFFTDWDHKLLPNAITWPLAALGLAVAPWNARLDLAPFRLGAGTAGSRVAAAAVGAALGYGVFAALALAWKVLRKKEGMGGGDLKLMLGVGAFTGMGGVLLTVFLGSIVGTLISLPLLLRRRMTMGGELPFGCFLTPAAAIAALYGNEILRWYLGMVLAPLP